MAGAGEHGPVHRAGRSSPRPAIAACVSVAVAVGWGLIVAATSGGSA